MNSSSSVFPPSSSLSPSSDLASESPSDLLSILDEDYKSGSDPLMVVQDLLESIHKLTRMKIGQGTDLNQSVSDEIRALIEDLSVKLTMADLSRAWQVLIKGLQEIKDAPDRLQAVEMIILRLIF